MARVGDIVEHGTFGKGQVLRLVSGGARVLVRFESAAGPPRVVAVTALRVQQGTVETEVRDVASAVPSIAPADARQSVEALRLGVVPAAGLFALTVGRARELRRLNRLLDSGDGTGMLIIEGHYGSGKSHLIGLAAQEARQRGWVLASATFDPLEVPPSHPLRIYRALVCAMQVPGGVGRGLLPLLQQAHAAPEGTVAAHRWLDAGRFAAGLLHEGRDEELALDVLELLHGRAAGAAGPLDARLRRAGYRGPRLLSLPDYRTFGQVLAHLLSGIGAWSQALGHRGLLVLLDEAEYLDRLGPSARSLADQVLRHLSCAALPDAALAFDPDATRRGGHAVHRAVSPRATGVPSIAVVAAFTPDPTVSAVLDAMLRDPDGRLRMRLRPIRGAELPALCDRVFDLIQQAWPQLQPEPKDRMGATRLLSDAFASGRVSTARQAARLVVAFWDLFRLDPARARAAFSRRRSRPEAR